MVPRWCGRRHIRHDIYNIYGSPRRPNLGQSWLHVLIGSRTETKHLVVLYGRNSDSDSAAPRASSSLFLPVQDSEVTHIYTTYGTSNPYVRVILTRIVIV